MRPTTHFMFSFDKNYVVRALDTYDSLHPTPYPVTFWMLCLDQESKVMIEKLKLPDAYCITLEEMNNKDLMRTRTARTNTEFAMASKSCFMSFLLNTGRVKDGEALILSDVDIHFFPGAWDYIDSVHRMKEYSIFMTPHNFPKGREWLVQDVGFYNGGFIYFRIDEASKECIHRYAWEAAEWTYLWHDWENYRHSDQMFMDNWRTFYHPRLYDVPHKGVNVGTWNIENYKITEKDGRIFVDEYPLVCYHYHGFRMYFDRKGRIRPYPITVFNDRIYDIYVKSLEAARAKLLSADPSWKYSMAPNPGILRLIKQTIMKNMRNHKFLK